MYADDTSILITANNEAQIKDKTKSMLASMTEQFSANGVVFNMEKTS